MACWYRLHPTRRQIPLGSLGHVSPMVGLLGIPEKPWFGSRADTVQALTPARRRAWLNARKARCLGYAIQAFLALTSARVSMPYDFAGMLICKRRSFFGSRQFTCGSIKEASTRSRYLMAMFMSESSKESDR